MALNFKPRHFHIEILRALNRPPDWRWYTSYELIKAIEDRRKAEGRYHWWTMVSYGGMHRALDKLVDASYIENRVASGRWEYKITPHGMTAIFVYGGSYR